MTHFFRGELAAALHHLDEGEPLYDPDEDRTSALVYLHDAKAAAISDRSLILWSFGRIDQALEVSRQSVEHARDSRTSDELRLHPGQRGLAPAAPPRAGGVRRGRPRP